MHRKMSIFLSDEDFAGFEALGAGKKKAPQ